jgi:hypothetical protein
MWRVIKKNVNLNLTSNKYSREKKSRQTRSKITHFKFQFKNFGHGKVIEGKRVLLHFILWKDSAGILTGYSWGRR